MIWPGRELNRARYSGSDDLDQGQNAEHLDHSLDIIGENVKAHLGFDFCQRLGEKMGCPHPRLEGAEGMFDGAPADGHGVGHVIEPFLHGVEHGFMIPAPDAAQLLQRATGFECAGKAGGQVAIEIDVAIAI